MLHLGPSLNLSKEAVTQTFGILAVRGAGKTNTAVVMAEEMYHAKLPFVVIDPVGNWWGLRAAADGKAPGLSLPIFGGQHGDVPLEKTGGILVADLVVDERLSAVLDVAEFSEGDKIRFLIDFAERLYRRNTEPLHLFLEEADDYCPQRPMREQARLLRAWENVVRRGRSRGLGMTMITQRSAALNKNVLTQIETLFVLRTTSPQDRKAIEGWVDYHGQSRKIIDSLPTLDNGEAWVWSPNWLKVCKRITVNRRTTYDSAATPTLAKRAAATLADIDLPAIRERMAATIERAKADDPKSLRAEIGRLKAEVSKQVLPRETIRQVEVTVFTEAEQKLLRTVAECLREQGSTLLEYAKKVETDIATIAGKLRLSAPLPPHRSSVAKPIRPQSQSVHVETDLSGPERRILDACAWLQSLGQDAPLQVAIAFLAGYTYGGGAFNNPKGRLRSNGLIEYVGSDRMRLSETGTTIATWPTTALTAAELQTRVLEVLPGPEQRILKVLLDAYPHPLTNEVCAERAGYSPNGGAFNNPRGRLRSLGLIEYIGSGQIIAKGLLFLEE